MDAAETAVRHNHDDVALLMFADDRRNNVVVLREVPRLLSRRTQVGNQPLGIQTLCFRKRRAEDGSENHLVGGTERRSKGVLEDAPA